MDDSWPRHRALRGEKLILTTVLPGQGCDRQTARLSWLQFRSSQVDQSHDSCWSVQMPMTTGGDDLHGFQLWINLPKAHKMVKPRCDPTAMLHLGSLTATSPPMPCRHPVACVVNVTWRLDIYPGEISCSCFSVDWSCRYQDYQADDIPIVEKDGVRVRVMAGSSYGAEGPVKVCACRLQC